MHSRRIPIPQAPKSILVKQKDSWNTGRSTRPSERKVYRTPRPQRRMRAIPAGHSRDLYTDRRAGMTGTEQVTRIRRGTILTDRELEIGRLSHQCTMLLGLAHLSLPLLLFSVVDSGHLVASELRQRRTSLTYRSSTGLFHLACLRPDEGLFIGRCTLIWLSHLQL